MSRIFLSHSSADNRAAVALKTWLSEQRPELANEIFLDIDPNSGQQVGTRWKDQLFKSNSRCEAVICLVSQAWEDSHECKTEYRTAEGLGKRILVARLEDLGGGGITAEWQRCDLFAEGAKTEIPVAGGPAVRFNIAALYRLRKVIEGTGVGPDTFVWPPRDDPQRAPYRGWEPFENIDAGVFFGRDAAIVRGLDELRAMRLGATKSLFVVLGPSGSGKSSFLRAGLIPRLQREDRRFVVLGIVRPGRNAVTGDQGFAAALHAGRQALELGGPPLGEIKTRCMRGDVDGVVELLTEIRAAATARLLDAGQDGIVPSLVLPLDQAEELFSADAGAQADQFLTLLAGVLPKVNADEAALLVAATIRTDRYEPMQNHPALDGIGSVLFEELKPMPPTLFETVITGPAGRAREGGERLSIAPDLVARLIADAGEGADTLPLLALTLARLYTDYASSGELTLANYEAMGGMGDVVNNEIDEILSPGAVRRRAELDLLRTAFIPWLATISSDSDQPMRRVARYDDLPQLTRPTIDALVEKRLLVRDERDGQIVVEVALESLLRQWDELAGWLREERQHLKTADDIERGAAAWASHDRDPAWLLTGSRFTEAETLAAQPGFSARLAVARDYLDACRHAENHRLAAEEEQRQAELRFAQERQQTAEAHAGNLRKRSRILQAVLAVTAIVAVIAVLGFTQANTQRHQAQARLRQAIAQRLNSEAADMLAGTIAGGDARAFQELLAARTLVGNPDEGALLHAAAIRATTAKIIDAGAALRGLAYSPNGHKLATGDRDHKVRLWDADTGQPIGQPLTGHTDVIRSVAFSPDGHRLASASADKTIRLWNADTGAPIGQPITGYADTVNSVAFSPDGHLLASGGADGTLRLWNPDTGKSEGATKPDSDNTVDAVAFSPDGHLLATANSDRTVRIYDIDSGRELRELKGHTSDVLAVAFSPDGHLLASGSSDANVRLWNPDTGQQIGDPLTGHSIGVTYVAFSPDGRLLASAGGDGAVRLWDPGTRQLVAAPLTGHTEPIWNVAFSPDGHRLASASDDHTLRVWDMTQLLTGNGSGMVDVKFSPDGHRLASGNGDGMVQLWNADTGQPLGPPLTGHAQAVTRVAYSPDGHRLASSSNDGSVRLWNADTGQPLGPPLTGNTTAVNGVAFSPDGHRLAAAGENGNVLMWDADTGRLVGPLMERSGDSAESVAFSPDGHLVAIADSDGTVRMRDAQTLQSTVAPLTGHLEPVYDVAFSPVGQRLASGGGDDKVWMWNPDTGKPIGTPLSGHTDVVEGVAFSPDGHRLVSGARDNTVRLWNVDTGQPVSAPFTGQSAWVEHVAFSPDGRRVASAGLDSTIRIWPTVATTDSLCAKLTTNMSHKQWHDWISPDLGYVVLCPGLPNVPD